MLSSHSFGISIRRAMQCTFFICVILNVQSSLSIYLDVKIFYFMAILLPYALYFYFDIYRFVKIIYVELNSDNKLKMQINLPFLKTIIICNNYKVVNIFIVKNY
jgi:hypothetical protein